MSRVSESGPNSGGVSNSAANNAAINAYNLNPLSIWEKAKARVLAGEGNADIVCIGDSITAGYGAVTASSYTGASAAAWPKKLADYLTASGIPANRNSFWGNQNVPLNGSTLVLYDSRITGMTGWSQANNSAWGGSTLNSNSTTNPLNFTPEESFDTIDVYYATLTSGAGTATVTVDGGSSLGTFNCVQATAGVYKATFDVGSVSSGTINITPDSTTTIFVLGVVAYNSNVSRVIVHNAGWAGSRATGWVAASNYRVDDVYAIRSQEYVFAPDLTIIGLGENEHIANDTPASFKSNLATLIAQAGVHSDIMLLTQIQIGTAQTYGWIEYADALKQQADNRIPYINLGEHFGTYADASATWYSDTKHLNGDGYERVAELVGQALR